MLINSFNEMLSVNKDLMKPIYFHYSDQEGHPLIQLSCSKFTGYFLKENTVIKLMKAQHGR